LKYLLWAVVGYLAWRWFKASQQNKSQAPSFSDSTTQASHPNAESMVKCAQCGIHIPISEALPGSDNLYFCSDSHRSSSRV